MKSALGILPVILLCAWLLFYSEGVEGTTPGKIKIPREEFNVLLITVDTLRYDRLGVYSDKYVKTPVIDRLARESYVFTRAFSHNPVTLPAHVNILTGVTPGYHGISDNSGFRLDERFLTLAEYLKPAGYRTGAFIGAFPLDSRFGLDQGFDVYDDHYGTHSPRELFFVERPAEKVLAAAIQWISSPGNPGKNQNRWFAWIHLFDPHQPYLPPPPYSQQYRHDLYSGEVAYVDASLKVLFDFLEKKRLMEKTIIIITGDHGEALGEKGEDTHSYFAYNNTIHIPLIFYIPGTASALGDKTGDNSGKGITVEENVCHTDIFPTLGEILGREIPKHLQGESLVPLMENPGKGLPPGKKPREIYFESLTAYLNRGWAPLRGFIRGDLKFIDLPIAEVYNLVGDPGETRNLAESSNVTQFKRDLIKLKNGLKGKLAMERSKRIDPEVQQKLKTLGYVTGSAPTTPKAFTKADDLKTMLPLQNRMLAAVGKYQDGKYREAIAELKAVAEESPGFILVYRHMATIHKEYGQVEKAIEILDYGLKKNPGNIELISKLGILLAETNQTAKAIELLNICIQKDPYDPENFNYLGVAYYKSRNAAKALENYRKALELDNNYASVFNNIGSLYLALYVGSKKTDERAYGLAMENFTRALEIDPGLFAAYNSRGAAYRFKNQLGKAIDDWKKTIEINPGFIDAYFNIGNTYLQEGDKASALKYFLQCRERFEGKLAEKDRQQLVRLIAEASR